MCALHVGALLCVSLCVHPYCVITKTETVCVSVYVLALTLQYVCAHTGM